MVIVNAHPVARLWHDEWKFCACGDADAIIAWLQKILEAYEAASAALLGAKEHQKRRNALDVALGPEPHALFLLYWLDSQGLTEHGGSVYGAWLSDKGKAVLEMLRKRENWNAYGYVEIEDPDLTTHYEEQD